MFDGLKKLKFIDLIFRATEKLMERIKLNFKLHCIAARIVAKSTKRVGSGRPDL